MEYEFTSNSADETIAFGVEIGEKLKGSEVVALIGNLGSGKTHLIKGIAQGCGAQGCNKNVNSPTFVIINEYSGRLEIYHIDCYRLETPDQFEMLGFDDYCNPDSVVLIEWADKVIDSLKGVELIKIEMSHISDNQRHIKVSNTPEYLKIRNTKP